MELSRSASKHVVWELFQIGPALALHLQFSFGTRARQTDLHAETGRRRAITL
jgi:hypothetical protein